MRNWKLVPGSIVIASVIVGAQPQRSPAVERREPPPSTYGAAPVLPPPPVPGEAPGINFAAVLGWTGGRTPQAPAGFEVTLFAGGLDNPRWLYSLPNGDVLVAESRTEKLGGEIAIVTPADYLARET